jgi:hypothetical protein
VTEFTFGPVFSAVEVSVTVLALSRNVCEHESGTAIAARHGGVLTPERKISLRMIEPGLARDNLPARSGMTCVAWNLEPSVWAAGGYTGTRNL